MGRCQARAIYPRGRLQAGLGFRRSHSLVPAASNAASIPAQTSAEPLTRSSGLGTRPRGSNAQAPATYSRRAGFPACPPARPEGYSCPCPLKRAEPDLGYFRPKPTWRHLEAEGVKRQREFPSKRWRLPSRRARAGGDVTSGAEEDEWCSEGQTKGGAGGAQRPAARRSGGGAGLPAGRPDPAGPGEWVGRGKGHELSLLETHSYTPPASCSAPGAPGSSGSPSSGWLPGGLPRQSSLAYIQAPPYSRSPGPHPLRGAAAREPPPRHPSASLRSTHWEFPPGLPLAPLLSPEFPQILTPIRTLPTS